MKYFYAAIATLAALCAGFATIGLMVHMQGLTTFNTAFLIFLVASVATNLILIDFAAKELENLEAEDLDCCSKALNY